MSASIYFASRKYLSTTRFHCISSHQQRLNDLRRTSSYVTSCRLPIVSNSNSQRPQDDTRIQQLLLRLPRNNNPHIFLSKNNFSTLSSTSIKEDDDDETTTTTTKTTTFTGTQFSSLPNLHPSTLKAITDILNLSVMTEIQEKTLSVASSGRDILGRARTGTGKTLAFLLPTIDHLLQNNKNNDDDQKNDGIGALILSPTRELATQIQTQTDALLTYHPTLTSLAMYGGRSKQFDYDALKKRVPSILVATPGRLLDHLDNGFIVPFHNNRERISIRSLFERTSVVILDETDHLLDMGFRDDLLKILSYLPPKNDRRNLLFSATLPKSIRRMASATLSDDFHRIDCIADDDVDNPAAHVNSQVKQSYVVLESMDLAIGGLIQLIKRYPREKIMIFFPTARLVQYFFALLQRSQIPTEVVEMHSKNSQGYRSAVATKFRNMTEGVMLTSDVSARGVDYPDVGVVIQYGMPDSRDTYVHRLGRTGRAGRRGRGVLLLLPFERRFVGNELGDFDVEEEEGGVVVEMEVKRFVDEMGERMRGGRCDVSFVETTEKAYRSLLLYYNNQRKRLGNPSKEEIVGYANKFAFLAGLKGPPEFKYSVAYSLGLLNIKGLNVQDNKEYDRRIKTRQKQQQQQDRLTTLTEKIMSLPTTHNKPPPSSSSRRSSKKNSAGMKKWQRR